MYKLLIKKITPNGYQVDEYNHIESPDEAMDIINRYYTEQIYKIQFDYIEE